MREDAHRSDKLEMIASAMGKKKRIRKIERRRRRRSWRDTTGQHGAKRKRLFSSCRIAPCTGRQQLRTAVGETIKKAEHTEKQVDSEASQEARGAHVQPFYAYGVLQKEPLRGRPKSRKRNGNGEIRGRDQSFYKGPSCFLFFPFFLSFPVFCTCTYTMLNPPILQCSEALLFVPFFVTRLIWLKPSRALSSAWRKETGGICADSPQNPCRPAVNSTQGEDLT